MLGSLQEALGFLGCLCHWRLGGRKHIFNINAVAHRGVADHHMRDGAHELAVLDDGRAAHECGQVGTTHFYRLCTVSTLFVKKIVLLYLLYIYLEGVLLLKWGITL